ncbi:hypothetical protein RYX56_00535 [Alkalihalophilus lindianensis]|uniref:Lipoprotein n=1 Tax=Alkalihalophilus lindianensis TaxID=1630542 RepID=A0ABU3X4P3_9BACI|nr:hypothetical protein [Alkalihalophilus lindianensis]MDV2682850.1 hypothetical protein [Alkalihalophilus lindianensis]
MFTLKQTGLLLIFASILIIITGCSTKNIDDAMREVNSVDLTTENIDGIKLGVSITDESFINEQGKFDPHPDNDFYAAQRNYDQYWNDRMIMSIDREKKEILQIGLLENNLTSESAKGIKVGMPIDQVISVYGEDYFTYNDKEQTIYQIGYVDHHHNLLILFTHFDNTVTNINVGYAFDRLKWE